MEDKPNVEIKQEKEELKPIPTDRPVQFVQTSEQISDERRNAICEDNSDREHTDRVTKDQAGFPTKLGEAVAKIVHKHWFIELFLKPFEERTSKDNTNLLARLKQFPFFEKSFDQLNTNNHDKKAFDDFILSCSKYLKYEKFESGQPICHKGDTGKTMYFVLEGEVGVLVPKSLEECEAQRKKYESTKLEFAFDEGFKNPSLEEMFKVADFF